VKQHDPKARNSQGSLEDYLTVIEKPGYLNALRLKYPAAFDAYRLAWDQAALGVVPPFPLHLELEVTNFCNLRCPACHCAKYTHGNGGRKFMTVELAQTVADLCSGRLPAMLAGASSECLLNPDLPKFLEVFAQCGVMDLMVHTNGQLLDEKMSRSLVELPLSRLNVSVDAATPEVYRLVRGGSLERLEANLKRFLAIRQAAGSELPYLRLTFLKQPQNMHEAEPFRAKWEGLADRIDFQDMAQPMGDGLETTHRSEDVRRDCWYPNRMLYIDYNGDVFPCCSFYYRFLKLGNVHEQTLDDIWNGDKIASLRHSIKTRNFHLACIKCLSY
jgi:radical SAM protein with 4Fe4S-binding SPASM domain